MPGYGGGGFRECSGNEGGASFAPVDNIEAAWVASQEVLVYGSDVRTYRVHMRVTFVLND